MANIRLGVTISNFGALPRGILPNFVNVLLFCVLALKVLLIVATHRCGTGDNECII